MSDGKDTPSNFLISTKCYSERKKRNKNKKKFECMNLINQDFAGY